MSSPSATAASDQIKQVLIRGWSDAMDAREKIIREAIDQGHFLDDLVWCRIEEPTLGLDGVASIEELRTKNGTTLARFVVKVRIG